MPCRFVYRDTTDGKWLQCSTTQLIEGVSQAAARRIDALVATGYAAIAGEPLTIHTLGDEPQIELEGTVTPGQLLKSGTTGKASAATSNADLYGGQVYDNGVSGEFVKMRVMPGIRGV